MKRLYVGCRVRLVWQRNGFPVVGREGRVLAIGFWPAGTRDPLGRPWLDDGSVRVDWGDVEGLHIPDQLEPIQDPGHQIVSWSECLWQPEGQPA